MINISKLVWDEWNVDHIARHGVDPSEVEVALKDVHRVILPTHNDRLLMLGKVAERLLSV